MMPDIVMRVRAFIVIMNQMAAACVHCIRGDKVNAEPYAPRVNAAALPLSRASRDEEKKTETRKAKEKGKQIKRK